MSSLDRIHTEKAPKAIGPYSQAMRLDNLVFTAGQIALDPESMEIVGDDVAAQTERVLTNLEAAGAELDTVLKTTVYLADMGDFAAMNDVYGRFFSSARPARSTIEAGRLPQDALVEIDAVAFRR